MNLIQGIKRILSYTFVVLLSREMPVWMTILGIIIGVYGTYIAIPKINEKLENDKIRVSYLMDNLKGINADTAELFSLVGIYSRKISSDPSAARNTEDIERFITKLHWKSIELTVVYGKRESFNLVKYQNSLDALRKIVVQSRMESGIVDMSIALRDFVLASHAVLSDLSQMANIRIGPPGSFSL